MDWWRVAVEHPTSGGGEDGLIGLQIISVQPRDQLLHIPTGSVAPNDLVFPLRWGFEEFGPCFSFPQGVLHPMILYFPSVGGLKNSSPTILMAKMSSLGDSLKSHLEISITGSFILNWPIVGCVGDSKCRGFPFPIVRLGDKDLLCTSAGLAEQARCGRTWEVRPVLPPFGVAS
jgi:hypothetical protein